MTDQIEEIKKILEAPVFDQDGNQYKISEESKDYLARQIHIELEKYFKSKYNIGDGKEMPNMQNDKTIR